MDLMRGEVFKKLFLDLYVVGSPGKPELLPTDPLFTQHTFLNFLNAAEKNAPLKRRITPTEVLPLYKAAALKVRKRLRKGYEHSDISALKTELYFFDNAFSFLCSDELEQDPTSIFQAMESMFETNPP